MEKVYVVYWSQTGNTETMANMLKSGVEAAGATAELLEASNADADTIYENMNRDYVKWDLVRQSLQRR